MRHGGSFVLDHVFITTSRGAPAAELLVQAGLTEGTPNRHPGQGTACRRFFFSNAMLELLWLEDEAEARSEESRATRLWERLCGARETASPFGIILRPTLESDCACPWPFWTYRPQLMPGLELEIAQETEIEEPMWCYLKTERPSRRPPDHRAGVDEITGILLGCPGVKAGSVTDAMAQAGVIAIQPGMDHLLELQFDDRRRGKTLDLRPRLPLVIRT